MPKRFNHVGQFFTDGLGVPPYGASASLRTAYTNIDTATAHTAADESPQGNISNSGDKNLNHATGVFYTLAYHVEPSKSKKHNSDV